ncbi:helix-turn-helix domain-containing protein [Streptomyces asiaticus]
MDTFSERLNRLFEVVHPQDRGPYSNQEVAKLLHERGGPTLSHVYLWQLRTGRRDNPTRRHLEALAEFFGVPVAYFFDDGIAVQVESTFALWQGLKNNQQVQKIAMRAVHLSPEGQAAVLGVVEQILGEASATTPMDGDDD